MKDDHFDYESEMDDEVDQISFGKYKGYTPVEVCLQNPGYIVWAATAYPQGWVGSAKIIELAKAKVPDQASHTRNKQGGYRDSSGGCSDPNSSEVTAFEEAMLETFGEFPTPYWKTFS